MKILYSFICLLALASCKEFKEISFQFEDVGLLSVGDPIRYRGVNIGKVANIVLHEGKVIVNAQINLDAPISFLDTGKIQNIGMFGERQIIVKSGTSKTLAIPGDTLLGVYEKQNISSINSFEELIDTVLPNREIFLIKKLADSIVVLNQKILRLEADVKINQQSCK